MNITYVLIIIAIIMIIAKKIKKSEVTDVFNLNNSALTRVIATFCIMYGHTFAAISGGGYTLFDNIKTGSCWVALFFIWSGYGVVYSYNKKSNYLNGFLYSRGVKILAPFFVVHIIYFAVKSLLGVHFSATDVLQGLIGGMNIVEFSWYPIAALAMYVLFYVSWKLPIKDKFKPIVLFTLVVIFTAFEYYVAGIHCDWWLISNLAFPLGVILFYAKDKLNKYKIISIFIGLIGSVSGMAVLSISNRIFGSVPDAIYIIGTNLQTTFLASAMIFSISAFSKLGNSKIIKLLNKISYEMYLCHGLLIFVFTKFISNGYLVMAFVLLLTPFLAYVVNKIDDVLIKKSLSVKLKG